MEKIIRFWRASPRFGSGPVELAAWPERAAIGLLAFPVILFFATWFHPLLGGLAALVALGAAVRLASGIAASPMPPRAALFLIAVISLFLTWTAGFGGMYHQSWDHNLSNALLHDLIEHPWPVHWSTPQGIVVLDSNIAWNLLPALVGKWLGWRAATLALAVLICLGCFLTILLFVRAAGTWKWWLPFVFFLWSGMDAVGCLLRGQFPGREVIMDLWSYPLWYQSNLLSFNCVAHLALPAWLVVLLIAGRAIGPRQVFGLQAFLMPLVPFLGVGCLPFALWGFFQGKGLGGRRIRDLATIENIAVPLVFLALCAPYFLGNREFGLDARWFWKIPPPPTVSTWIKYAAFWMLEILVPALAVWVVGVRDRLFLLTVAILCLIPLWSTGSENEWVLYVSGSGLLLLSLHTARAFLVASKARLGARWLLIGVFAIGALAPLQEFWKMGHGTFAESTPFEADCLKTYDPSHVPAASWYAQFVRTYHSRPLGELPLLRSILAPLPSANGP